MDFTDKPNIAFGFCFSDINKAFDFQQIIFIYYLLDLFFYNKKIALFHVMKKT